VCILFTQLTAKRIELLAELVPQAKVIAVLVNPDSPTTEPTIRKAQEAGHVTALQIPVVKATTESEIDVVFASLAALHVDGLVVGTDPFFDVRRAQLVKAERLCRLEVDDQFERCRLLDRQIGRFFRP